MAPKSSSSAKEKLIGDEDEVLQAIILADSFNKRFKPLTTRKPRCLLPICNAPLLEWTFESLALAGVQEIFVICRSHASQIKAAIAESKWSRPGSGIKISTILTAKETYSPGDAMRDVYTRGLVTSDFVLVAGDLVSNVRIDEVVKAHKERRKTNKDAIMTMVVKPSGVGHRTRSKADSAVFVMDSETSELLHYEPVEGYPKKKEVRIPRELFAEHPELDIRNDLIDCCIDVCSIDVPPLFQDNFDYLDLRRDFVHGVLTSDLLMKNIHCYVVKEGYAARVKDTKTYDAVSKDILSRWTFPLVPDDNHPSGHAYEHRRGNKYIAKDNSVVLSRTCKIGNNTLIGSSTQVYDNASVSSSVIGQNCIIGSGTIIKGAYIFDGTVIGPNCVVEQSIIGAGVSIKENTTVQKGCLLGDGVTVGPNAKVQSFERLSRKPGAVDEEDEDEDDSDDEDEGADGDDESEESSEKDGSTEEDTELDSDIEEVEKMQANFKVALGKDSNALIWPRGPLLADDESEEEDSPESFTNQRFMRIADTCSDLAPSESDSEMSDASSSDSDASSSGVQGLNTSLLLSQPTDEFESEVKLSLERAFLENHSVDNAAVELKTLRMASNVELTLVRKAVVASIVDKIELVEGDAGAQRKKIGDVIGRWGDLINRIGGVDGVETVSILQTHCVSSPRLPLFGQILVALYQDDIVDEDDIRAWHASPAAKGQGAPEGTNVEDMKKCWLVGAKMIVQFDEQESSEEDDDDDEDENEDEEDDGDSEEEAEPKAKATPGAAKDEESSDEDSEDDAAPPAKPSAPAAASTPASKPAPGSASESDEEDEDESSEEDPAPSASSVSAPKAGEEHGAGPEPSLPPPQQSAASAPGSAPEPAPVAPTAEAKAQDSTSPDVTKGAASSTAPADFLG